MSDRYVLVTTKYRGVFAGYLASEESEEMVILTEARNCLFWSEETKGFLSLAANGPAKGSRIGPACARSKLYGITSISDISDAAKERWELERWNS